MMMHARRAAPRRAASILVAIAGMILTGEAAAQSMSSTPAVRSDSSGFLLAPSINRGVSPISTVPLRGTDMSAGDQIIGFYDARRQDGGSPRERALFERRDALVLAGFAAGALALGPFDRALADAALDPELQENTTIGNGALALEWLGFPGVAVLSGGAYVGGLIVGNRDLADIGLHTFGAIGIAEVLTIAIKGVAGRSRPHLGADPDDFELFRGFRGDAYQSFPSAHTTAAFAAAAALTSEIGERRPQAKWWVGAMSFSGATLVGLSRMYHDEHWASDVVIGAAVGTFGGWKVVQYLHDRPNNWIDGRFLPQLSPTANGDLAIIWTIRSPAIAN